MQIHAYPTLTTPLQAFFALAAVPTTSPWSVSRAGSGRTVAEKATPIRPPVVDGHRTRDVPGSRRPPGLADTTPPDPLRCGILVGDELRLVGGPRGDARRTIPRV